MHALYRQMSFMLGVSRARQFPPDVGSEVVFAGRSNSGKSSAINAIAGVRSMARVSKTPGRTREINFFRLDDRRRLVDLPGYGYARVPEHLRQRWVRVLDEYFRTRRSLRAMVLIMDIRHPFKPPDLEFLSWCPRRGLPGHILLTKADKLSRAQSLRCLSEARARIAKMHTDLTAQLFSATASKGVDEARERLDGWWKLLQDPSPDRQGT